MQFLGVVLSLMLGEVVIILFILKLLVFFMVVFYSQGLRQVVWVMLLMIELVLNLVLNLVMNFLLLVLFRFWKYFIEVKKFFMFLLLMFSILFLVIEMVSRFWVLVVMLVVFSCLQKVMLELLIMLVKIMLGFFNLILLMSELNCVLFSGQYFLFIIDFLSMFLMCLWVILLEVCGQMQFELIRKKVLVFFFLVIQFRFVSICCVVF